MKKCQVLSGLLALTLLTGCGAAQVPAETAADQTPPSQQSEAYSFPERFTGDWISQEGKLTIHADAQVTAAQGTALPTAAVAPRQFDQADVDNLLKVFLKGAPLYDRVSTKQELREILEGIRSTEYKPDPDAPTMTQEELDTHQRELIAWYEAELAKAPEERPVIHGFADSHDPEWINGTATVDGIDLSISIHPDLGWAEIERDGFEWDPFSYDENQTYPSEESAIAQADNLMEELGLDNMACDDVRPGGDGILMLYYVPTVNGIRLSSIREDFIEADGTRSTYQYWAYGSSEETNPDSVSWYMENIQIFVGTDGICSFVWHSPSGETTVKEEHTVLLPFEEIASIANTMLPIVIIGPTEARSLVDLDQINGFDTKMDVEITKVSLTLMRVRDKGSLQGTIIPVWDFWCTWDWYDADGQQEANRSYTAAPLLTLNAVDGTVVSRMFGY